MPEGLRNLGAVSLRYSAQATAYLFLVTERYPYSAPAVRDRPRDVQLELPLGAPAPRPDAIEARLSRAGPLPLGLVAIAGVVWAWCAVLLLRTAVPSDLPAIRIDTGDGVRRGARPSGRARRALLPRHLGALADRALHDALDLRPPRPSVRSRVRRRADRHRDAARDARARDRLARPAALRAAQRLVGTSVRPHRGRLPRVGVRRLVRARRRLRVDLRRAAHRHVPRPQARRDLVDSRSRRVRRHRRRASPSRSRTSSPRRRRSRIRPAAVGDRVRAEAGRRRAYPISVEDVSGTTSQANAYAVGFGPPARSSSGARWSTARSRTARCAPCSPTRSAITRATTSRRRSPGSALFALPGAWILMRLTRRRGGMGEAAAIPLALLVVAALQLATAPAQAWISRRHGVRGRLEGAADDPGSGCGARALRRVREDVARRSGPARVGARAPRQPPDARAAGRDG